MDFQGNRKAPDRRREVNRNSLEATSVFKFLSACYCSNGKESERIVKDVYCSSCF